MKRLIVVLAVLAVLALVAVSAAVADQAAARQRDYSELLTRGDSALRDDQTFGAIEGYSGAIALRPSSMLAFSLGWLSPGCSFTPRDCPAT